MSYDPVCVRCKLCEGRTQVVPADGDLSSRLVLVGEAPGEREDMMGRPFVGRAGKWLDICLQQAGIDRTRILITNTVKCRPPENRRPECDEIAACRPFLVDDLKDAKLIVTLGSTAYEGLTGQKVKVGEVANKIVKTRCGGLEITLLPTYHPSACIYNKEARVKLAEALSFAREYCDLIF